MEITLKILGKRLKEYRIHLGLKQNDIAKMLQINQNAISRIENGICGGIESYLSLINYFSQYFVIDNLFNVHFHVIEKNANNNLDSIAISKLKLIQDELNQEINKVINYLEN